MTSLVVVMGVSGCGKSTVAESLANKIGWNFVDGDSLHPPQNVNKMKQGIPLTDDDRWPWLDAVRSVSVNIVVACSALKKSYRDFIREKKRCKFVFLKTSREVLERRIHGRNGHFMPLSLLTSQLNTLEEPIDEKDALTILTDTHNIEECVDMAAKFIRKE